MICLRDVIGWRVITAAAEAMIANLRNVDARNDSTQIHLSLYKIVITLQSKLNSVAP